MKRLITRAQVGAVVLTVAVGALSACGNQADSAASTAAGAALCPTKDTTGTIKIGLSSKLNVMAPLLLAMETDAFKGTGLDVSIEWMPAADSLPLVARGQLDAQATTVSSSHFNILHDGVEIAEIAPMDNQKEVQPGTAVAGYWARKELVGDDPANPDLSKLKGVQITTASGGTGVSGLILEHLLKKVGLGFDDVKMAAPLTGPDALTALSNGAVKVAWISSPFDIQAAKDPNIVPIGGFEPGVTGSAIFAGRSLLDRPKVVVKFLQVLQKVTQEHLSGDYNHDPKSVELLAKAEEIPASTVEAGETLKFDPTFSMEGTKQFAENLQEFAIAHGQLEYDKPIDVSDFTSDRFSKALESCKSVV